MRGKRTLIGLISAGLVGLSAYLLRRQMIARWLKLRPLRYRVSLQRGLRVPMSDGVYLAADLYSPQSKRLFPTILVRTPYGRGTSGGLSGALPGFFATRFAERGYNVVVQDVRGCFDSQGEFEPFVNEARDGRATLEWLENQPWFNGVLGMWGPSYLGYTQWAVAGGAPLYLKALMPLVTSSRLPKSGLRDHAYQLDTLFRWMMFMDMLLDRRGILNLRRISPCLQQRALNRTFRSLPLKDADMKLVGRRVPYYQTWLEHLSPDDPYWRSMDFSHQVGHVVASVHLVSGWYDILLRDLLEDYTSLRRSGSTPYLTIGPWHHQEYGLYAEGLRQSLDWFDGVLKGERSRIRKLPVRLYVMGNGGWREYQDWPPSYRATRYYLDSAQDEQAQGGSLRLEQPASDSPADQYIYDPANPTPTEAGALLSFQAGARDNRALEARPDVLIYTTPELESDLELIGPVALQLYVHSSQDTADFFGRLCDVYPDGRSINICDGLTRVHPGLAQGLSDGIQLVEVDMWATAYRFQRGHRIRLQVSSGAHPRYNRNLGTLTSQAEATELHVARQTIYHDSQHPSALILPVSV